MENKIQLHNPQALFNMVRILEEYLINRSRLFVIILLPVDLIIASALFISYIERIFAHKIVRNFLLYINYDLSYFREFIKMIVSKDYISKELTEKIDEEKISGKLYQNIRRVLKFIWNIFILLVVLPVLPIFWTYDFLAPKVMIGFVYYVVIFNEIHWVPQIYLFGLATFLVASTTVPFFFELFVYVKYLFELRRRTFNEIQSEARTFFLKLYKYNLPQEELDAEEKEKKVEGGLYYLFLVFLHYLKDKGIEISKTIIFAKKPPKLIPDLGLKELKGEVIRKRSEPREAIHLSALIMPFMALFFTFIIAYALVFAGTQGRGILGSLVLSVVNQKESLLIWGKFMGTNMGYLEYIILKNPYIPDFLYYIGLIMDKFFHYLFLIWHVFFPFYINFIASYYKLWWRVLT